MDILIHPLEAAAKVFFSLSYWHFLTIHFCESVERFTWQQSSPSEFFLAQASCWAELKLFNIVWNLAIRTPLRGPSTVSPHCNHCTNSQQAWPFPMIMNGNVPHVSIHLSDTHWCLIKPQKCVVWPCLKPGCCKLSISRYIGSLRYRAKRNLGCHALSDMSSWVQR